MAKSPGGLEDSRPKRYLQLESGVFIEGLTQKAKHRTLTQKIIRVLMAFLSSNRVKSDLYTRNNPSQPQQ